jgi:TRAP-type C4-dicarboxylate transport system permease small subunit
MARFAFIWIIMIGSIIAVHDGTHFNIDIFPNLSPRMKRVMDLLFIVVMLIASVVFIIGGYKFAQFGAIQRSELAGLPMLAIYIAWPLAGVSWMLFLVEHLVDHFTGVDKEGE